MNKPNGMAAYIAVTAAYWAFMLSDGALRMLVLLHFHTLGFSPVQLAYCSCFMKLRALLRTLALDGLQHALDCPQRFMRVWYCKSLH